MTERILINSKTFPREMSKIQGDLPISRFSRIADLLTDSTGVIHYFLQGGVDFRNEPQLELTLDGTLFIRCQRCLEKLDYSLKVCNLFSLIDNEEVLTQKEIEDDSRDFLVAQEDFDVLALIEDEVLLDLPIVPRHESCVLPSVDVGAEKISPFAVLRKIKH